MPNKVCCAGLSRFLCTAATEKRQKKITHPGMASGSTTSEFPFPILRSSAWLLRFFRFFSGRLRSGQNDPQDPWAKKGNATQQRQWGARFGQFAPAALDWCAWDDVPFKLAPTPTSPEPNQGGTVRKQMEVSATPNSLASHKGGVGPPRQANLGNKFPSGGDRGN